jgi:regulatory protein
MEYPVHKMQSQSQSQDMAEPENIKAGKPRREKKPPKKITEKYLYNSGLAYLQRFPASTPHFRRVMGRKIDRSCNCHKEQSKEGCLALLESAIAQFERMGLLNDEAYLSGMINSLRRRGLSKQAILSKLGMKGLPQDRVSEALRGYDEDSGVENADLVAALLLTRRKRLGAYRRDAEADRNKELASLARAGFGFDIAQKVLNLGVEEAEELIAQRRL